MENGKKTTSQRDQGPKKLGTLKRSEDGGGRTGEGWTWSLCAVGASTERSVVWAREPGWCPASAISSATALEEPVVGAPPAQARSGQVKVLGALRGVCASNLRYLGRYLNYLRYPTGASAPGVCSQRRSPACSPNSSMSPDRPESGKHAQDIRARRGV